MRRCTVLLALVLVVGAVGAQQQVAAQVEPVAPLGVASAADPEVARVGSTGSAPIEESPRASSATVVAVQPGLLRVVAAGNGKGGRGTVGKVSAAITDEVIASRERGGRNVPPEVLVDVLASKNAVAAGFEHLAFDVRRVDDGDDDVAVDVVVDVSGFAGAYGGDWLTRVQIAELPGCGGTVAGRLCATDLVRYETKVDLVAMTVSATVLARRRSDVKGPPDVTAELEVGGEAVGGRGRSRSMKMQTTPSGSAFGFSSSPGGQAGNWAATPLSKSSKWDVAPGTGAFTWSYPIPVRDGVVGSGPGLSVAYNSAGIDGQTAEANNQGSWVGPGWSTTNEASIQRRYRSCSDDGGSAGDFCFFTDSSGNWDHLVLSLNGHSSELVPLGNNVFRLKDDPGWRVVKKTSGQGAGTGPANTDSAGEWFEVTTPDGTVYSFGLNKEPTSNLATQSVWSVPVRGNHSNEPCYAAPGWCQRAWKWNLDRVARPIRTSAGDGWSVSTYMYQIETNRYGFGGAPADAKEYARAGSLVAIAYSKIGGHEADAPPAKVTFEVHRRCTSSNASCDSIDPVANPTLFLMSRPI